MEVRKSYFGLTLKEVEAREELEEREETARRISVDALTIKRADTAMAKFKNGQKIELQEQQALAAFSAHLDKVSKILQCFQEGQDPGALLDTVERPEVDRVQNVYEQEVGPVVTVQGVERLAKEFNFLAQNTPVSPIASYYAGFLTCYRQSYEQDYAEVST